MFGLLVSFYGRRVVYTGLTHNYSTHVPHREGGGCHPVQQCGSLVGF